MPSVAEEIGRLDKQETMTFETLPTLLAEALASRGVPLTLGSDAHAPHQVGRHFEKALEGLRKAGVKELVRFKRRRMVAVPVA